MRPSFVILAGVLGALGACSTPNAVTPNHHQEFVVPALPVDEAKRVLVRRMNRCWLDPRDPVLTKHRLVPSPPATQTDGPPNVQGIEIAERISQGESRSLAFAVDMTFREGGTVVRTRNMTLPYGLAQKLSADIGYWLQGGNGCSSPADSQANRRGSF